MVLVSLVLIESDWNLKTELTGFQCRANFGINRIRLEFKVWMTASHRTEELTVLIESDWNLKLLHSQ